MFRWRQQRIHESLDSRALTAGHQWAPGVQMRKLPPPTPFQSLAGKIGHKMVPDSILLFHPEDHTEFSKKHKVIRVSYSLKRLYECDFWIYLIFNKDHQDLHTFQVPFFWLVQPCLSDFFWQIVSLEPRPVSWEESGGALAHCLEDEELPGAGQFVRREIIPFHFVPLVIPGQANESLTPIISPVITEIQGPGGEPELT